jgi:hypothetical protein
MDPCITAFQKACLADAPCKQFDMDVALNCSGLPIVDAGAADAPADG